MVSRYQLIISMLFVLFICACEDPESLPANQYAQEHIPWPSLADSPWPIVRHDAQGTGRSQYSGPKIGDSLTVINTGAFSDGAAVIGTGNTIYFTTYLARECFLNRYNENLAPQWMLFLDESVEIINTPTLIAQDALYMTSQLGSYLIRALSNTADISYSYDNFIGFISNVTTDFHGNSYFIAGESYCLTSLYPDGSIKWQIQDHGQFHNGLEPGVFSPNGDQFYSSTKDSLLSINTDGEVLWSYYTGVPIWHTLIDNAGFIYFYNYRINSLQCLTSDGDERWSVEATEYGVSEYDRSIAHTIDTEGNLYYSGRLECGTRGIISVSNEGEYRWFHEGGSSTDLICDKDNNIFISFSIGFELIIKSISSEGQMNFELSKYLGNHLASGSPSVDASGRVFIPIKNRTDVQFVLISD